MDRGLMAGPLSVQRSDLGGRYRGVQKGPGRSVVQVFDGWVNRSGASWPRRSSVVGMQQRMSTSGYRGEEDAE